MTPPREVIAEAIRNVWADFETSEPWYLRAADAVLAALETPEAVDRVAQALPRTMMDGHDRDKYARLCVRALLHGGDADGDE